MPAFELTAEQKEIVKFVRDETRNLAVIARAGTGKTSTIVQMAGAMREPSALCLAFNKAIAVEMEARLPDNCQSSTLNSLGHRAWGDLVRARLQLDKDKNYRIVQKLLRSMDQKELSTWDDEIKSNLARIVVVGKTAGYLPSGIPDTDPILTDKDFFDGIEYVLTETQQKLIADASRISWDEAIEGTIDFNDQILCPTVHRKASFKSHPITFVDEAQDLSSLNHRMVEKVVRNNRLVIVGDPCQAIYGFRGAEEDSMYILMSAFHMAERKLTISFRCDSSIIENVHWRAPDMKWREGAPEGSVVTMEAWSAKDIPDFAAVLCRNNAPLLGAFIQLLEAGRKVTLGNREAIDRLVKILDSIGTAATTQERAFELIDLWERKSRRIRKDDGQASDITDVVLCLKAVCGMYDTLGEARNFLAEARSSRGDVLLSTIHKSKGLEFDTVFILDVDLIAPVGQDRNVRYVAETRAKHTLNYVSTDGYVVV